MPPSDNRALAERLSGLEREEPVLSRPAVARSTPVARRRGGRWLLPLLVAVALVLAAALAGVSALAYSNKSRADD
jgi:hypothetical protein